ncbi:hypothetical protein GCM10023166_04660 [Paeniglutamicibacter cryotolerans]
MGRIGEIRETMASLTGYRDGASAGTAGSEARPVTLQDRIQNSTVAGGTPVAPSGIDPEAFTQALGAALGNGDAVSQLSAALNPVPVSATVQATGQAGVQSTALVPGAAPVQAVAGPVTSGSGTTGDDVVAAARKYLGVPYIWGGNNPKIGLDCSSLVQHAFKDLGVSLPRVARDQAKQGTEVPSLKQAKPGDLIVTRGGGHIGIYLGDNRMLHAPRPGENVSIRELFETDADIMTIRRIVPANAAQAASVPTGHPTGADRGLAAQRAAFEGAKT